MLLLIQFENTFKNRVSYSDSSHRRRFASINGFSRKDSIKQLELGNVAMGSLLKGSYCLENHFHYHQLEITADKIGDQNPGYSKDSIPERSRPYEEYDPYMFEKSVRSDDMDILDDMDEMAKFRKANKDLAADVDSMRARR
jgi:hypothetical protein